MQPDFRTDMPTLVIDDDDRQPHWFAYVIDGPTLGYTVSLPQSVDLANQIGHPVGYWMRASDRIQMSAAAIVGSVQQNQKDGE